MFNDVISSSVSGSDFLDLESGFLYPISDFSDNPTFLTVYFNVIWLYFSHGNYIFETIFIKFAKENLEGEAGRGVTRCVNQS